MKKIYFLVFVLFTLSSQAQVVINEVYGGGGNSGADYKNDFVELYNNGSTAISLAGWSVQYASSTGTSWNVTALSGSIPANGYFLIQMAAGSGGLYNLPTPDVTGTTSMSASSAKIILVNVATTQTGSCPTGAQIIDKVGFGTANCFETAVAPAASNTTSISRIPLGTDSNNNSTDFTAGSPSPTNSSGPDVTAPVVTTLLPANGATDVSLIVDATITFNEDIKTGTGNIIVKRSSDNSTVQTLDVTSNAVTTSGKNVIFSTQTLAVNTSYYLLIDNGAIRDIIGNNFAGISSPSVWQFTTGSAVTTGNIDFTYDLNTCTSSIPSGFSQYSSIGAQVWACTTFGRDPANPAGTAAFPSAVTMNGYTTTNVANEDWFISPSFDLNATTFPILSFWSRTAFNGLPLQLKVSTDYTGSGDPAAATWSNVNGKFPGLASNVWTLSDQIDLTPYKSSTTYFAFVYSSSDDEGARWSLDDIRVSNSATAPAAEISTNTSDIQFGYVPATTDAIKFFTVNASNLTANLTLSATGNFLISKTTNSFTSSISFVPSEVNNLYTDVYVQFIPPAASTTYTGTVTLSTAGPSNIVIDLKGNSIDDAQTLEVVNWNIEWFGTPNTTLGPPNKNLQEANVKTILRNINADVYALTEIVGEASLQSVVADLNAVAGPGAYDYVLSNYGSYTNPFASGASPLAEAQKQALIYKTSVVSIIGTPAAYVTNGVHTMADLSNPAYNYFSSGRYPFMVNTNVTLGGVTKQVRFVVLHAKANTSPTATAYARRKNGSDTLNFRLNADFPNDNIILLGDFNDDLDVSITAGFTTTSYSTFVNDNTRFFAPTYTLSLQGKKSTVSYSDMIDHVEISNEMQEFYMSNTAGVLSNVSSLVSNYGSTTSDHYPIFTRYAFDPVILPVTLSEFTVVKKGNAALVQWTTEQELNSKSFIVEHSTDGFYFTAIATIAAKGNSSTKQLYSYNDNDVVLGKNYYRLKIVDIDGKQTRSSTKWVSFDNNKMITVYPNPATDKINIQFRTVSTTARVINLVDEQGKVVYQGTSGTLVHSIATDRFAKGIYYLQVQDSRNSYTEKVMVK